MTILTIIFFITMMVTNVSITVAAWKGLLKKAPKSPLKCAFKDCDCEADILFAGNTYCNGHK